MANLQPIRSSTLLEALNQSIDTSHFEESDKTNLEWKKAVAEELKTLFEENINLRKTNTILNKNITTLNNKINNLESNINEILLRCDKFISSTDIKTIKTGIDSKINEIEESFESNINEINKKLKKNNCDLNSTTIINRKNNIKIPKFKGMDYERPIKFISDLKKYLNSSNFDNDEEDFICLLSQALEGNSQEWLYLNESEIRDIETFEKKFRDRYWNNTIQIQTRRRIEFGYFNTKGKTRRVDYATHLLNFAKDLNINNDIKEIINQISNHFNREIRQACIMQKPKTIEDFLSILNDFDNEEKRNNYKKGFNENNDKSKYENNQNKDNYYDKNKNYGNNNNTIKKSYQNSDKYDNNKKYNENYSNKKSYNVNRTMLDDNNLKNKSHNENKTPKQKINSKPITNKSLDLEDWHKMFGDNTSQKNSKKGND